MKSNSLKRTDAVISSLDGLPYFLNLEQVAGLTGFSYETVKKFCRAGIIPARKIGKEWRVTKDELANFGRSA